VRCSLSGCRRRLLRCWVAVLARVEAVMKLGLVVPVWLALCDCRVAAGVRVQQRSVIVSTRLNASTICVAQGQVSVMRSLLRRPLRTNCAATCKRQ
jgi:hypothetical protein